MGTPNFASPSNASKYFVVLTSREEEVLKCSECGEVHHDWESNLENLRECSNCESEELEKEDNTVYPESWAYEDLVENLGHEIKSLGGRKESEHLDTSRYSISSIGVIEEEKYYGDIDITVKITSTIQSAYYDGATLDWLVEVESRGETWKHSTGSHYDETLEDIVDMIFDPYYSEMNAGLCKIMQPKAVNWVEQTISEIEEKLEKLYEDWSKHKLHCKGVFSNGEAIYETV